LAAQYRLTASAKADITAILSDSAFRHGRDARDRYAALILAALRRVAKAPEGRSTAARPDVRPDIRSFHIRHSRNESQEAPVGNPVHVIFYRAIETDLIEIVRVLHDRMEPSRHMDSLDSHVKCNT
jgi:toxin ParE1/3/4